MSELTDKAMLLICCMVVYNFTIDSVDLVIPFLLCLTLGSFSTYFRKSNISLILYGFFLFTCFFNPSYLLFLPFMMYDIILTEYQYVLFSSFLILSVHGKYYLSALLFFLLLFCFLSFYLKYKTKQQNELDRKLAHLKDTSTELMLVQEEKNRSLLDNQDYEINLAMLNERNRISKEIHDHIGHLLSRSLLQIGALLTISKEPLMTDELTSLKNSISEGMDSIRSSIHNMHDDSVDLYASLKKLVRDFIFCAISFEYDLKEAPPLKIRYCLIATVTEALANVMKHSNATKVSILVMEQPALYKLIIMDNGTVSETTRNILSRNSRNGDYSDGMGLHNIADRIKGFNGSLDITGDNGFRIYLTIPKTENNTTERITDYESFNN